MYIFKYNIGRVAVDMPKGAKILSLQMQNGKPIIWAIVDPLAEIEKKIFIHCTTGPTSDQPYEKYIGTYQEDSGLVYHIFEE